MRLPPSCVLSIGDPYITAVTPNVLPVAAGLTTITVHGLRFQNGAKIEVGPSAQPTIFVNDKTLTTQFDPTTVGTVQVTVRNPNDEESNDFPFSVVADPPASTLSGVDPATTVQGGAPITVRVLGTGFTPDCAVVLGPLPPDATKRVPQPTTFVSPTELTFTHHFDIAAPYEVTVRSHGGYGVPSTNFWGFTVAQNPNRATISSVTPNTVVAGVPTTVTVVGTKFTLASHVTDRTTDFPTTYVSPTQVTAQIQLAGAASKNIYVETDNFLSSEWPITIT